MSRFASILAQELRLAARDRALAWLLLAFTAMAAYGAWTGAQWRTERLGAVAAFVGELADIREHRQAQFANAQPGELPFAAQPQGVPFRPILAPGPLAALSIGQSESYPYAARMLPLSDDTIFDASRVYVDNPAVRAAGRFDLAFVIVVLMPLMLLAASYDFWACARERGVGAMALSQPVAPRTVLLAKAVARLVLVLGPMSLACVAALGAFAGIQPAGLGMAWLTIVAYGMFWIALALAINVVVRRSAAAAVASGVLWLVVVALGPALGLAVVDLAQPAPSAIAHGNALRAIYLDHRAEVRARPPLVEPVPAPELPQRLRVFMADALDLEARKAPVRARYQAAVAERRARVDALRFLLPSVAAQDALDRIAGSDADRAVAFQAQVLAFRGVTREWLAARLDADAPMTLDDYSRVPAFSFRESDPRARLLGDWAVLLAATFALAAFALWRLGRRHPLEP